MTKTIKHLPYYQALQDYPESEWLIFGTLTHRYETSAKNQLARFNTLMTALGLPNKTQGKRLHWVARLEGGHTTATDEEHTRLHIHFLLSRYKLTNGKKYSYSYETLVQVITDNWPYGKVDLPKYEQGKNGLGYILKANDDEAINKSDEVEISRSLMTFLSNKKQYEQIDQLGSEIYQDLKLSGSQVYFGDEVEKTIRKKRAANETNQR
jgi:hypothetical protein